MGGKGMVRCVRVVLGLGLLLPIMLGLTISHPRAATNPALAFFLGYSKTVNAVALSPNGQQAASGGADNFLRLWDAETGLLLRTFDAETNSINAVAFSPDGRQILTGTNEKRLQLWDIATGRAVKTMDGHTGEVTSVAFSPDGRQVLSGSNDKTVKLWDLETSLLLKTFEGHTAEVSSVAFSTDGGRALSGSKDKTLRLWDAGTGELLKTFEGHTDEVTSVALLDGAALSGSKDKTVKLWDASAGQLLKTFEGHSGEVLSVGLSSDGSRIVSASKDKTLKLWDVKAGALIKTLEGHSDSVTSAVFSRGGRQVLSGSSDKTLKIWDAEAGQLLSTIDLQSEAFWPNGYRNFFAGASLRHTADPSGLDKRLQEKGLKRGNAVFLRIFKADLQVELWMERSGRFELFDIYPICAWSGQLGPKLQEGDSQSPEGFYTIGKGQLNPNSHYHRAFNLGYPNFFDRAHNRTGANLMVHGGCGSIGCYAMTDAVIDELWLLVTAALNSGQEIIAVHVFPFRMTRERLAAFGWHPSAEFWRDLKPAYDLFEQKHIPPKISVCNKRYTIQPGQAAPASAAVESVCPSNRAGFRQSTSASR
jgi:WD40 repeat protein/murein L,D-transpeptidase YafK